MLSSLRRIRFTELQLLITALLFFASGYLLTSLGSGNAVAGQSVAGLLRLLWPSSLPILLFVLVSLILAWRLAARRRAAAAAGGRPGRARPAAQRAA